jgi:hypothetical protein
MTGTTHFLAGAAIGKATGNSILAIIFGFIFHFIMDLVPHWDYGYYFEKKLKHFIIAASDPLIGVLIYVGIGLYRGYDFHTWLVTFLGGCFCLLPDVMGVFIRLFRLKRLKWLNVIHNRVHWFIKGERDVMAFEKVPITNRGVFLGIIYQIPFIVVSVLTLIR